MKNLSLALLAVLAAAPLAASAQWSSSISALVDSDSDGAHAVMPGMAPRTDHRPFSQIAFGGGTSTLGINFNAATNVNRYFNLRGTGNVFNYSLSNVNISDFAVGFKLNMASAGASLDFYPFPGHGFRLSPGVLFYNTSNGSGTFSSSPGSSFTLNHVTYYSSNTNPVQGSGSLGLHTQNPAFSITTGWGNMIPRNNKHLSFPMEIGVAFIGSPAVNVALTSGYVCTAQGAQCVNVATDQALQGNLQEQVSKYRNDLDPLKTFPIFAGGVAYNFAIR